MLAPNRLHSDMKTEAMEIPPEMKHILTTLGVADTDYATAERRMKERAAMQVQDYLEVACRKISQFHGIEVSTDTHETMEMLWTHKQARRS